MLGLSHLYPAVSPDLKHLVLTLYRGVLCTPVSACAAQHMGFQVALNTQSQSPDDRKSQAGGSNADVLQGC